MSELTPPLDVSRTKPANAANLPKDMTLGDFRLKKRIGSGSMGAVYLAHQISRERPAALKVLFNKHASRPDYVERFYREAALLNRLRHPNIVRCYRAGRDQGLCYLGMEFVDGVTLHALLKKPQQLPVQNVLHLISVSAQAMQHAHDNAVIHRDLKPTNLMITWRGLLKIADMGIARATDVDSTITGSNLCIGTLEYMPPEQARCSRDADAPCDIYALGTVFYELLTGALPFRGASPVDLIIAKDQTFFIPASRLNPRVPSAIDAIIQRCLRPDPSRRYQSFREFLSDLALLEIPPVPLNLSKMGVPMPQKRQAVVSRDQMGANVLLLHASPDRIDHAQEALEQMTEPGEIEIAEDGFEALGRLRSAVSGEAPFPSLVILSVPFPPEGSRELLQELRINSAMHQLRVLVLASTATARMVMRAEGFASSTLIRHPEELEAFEVLLPA